MMKFGRLAAAAALALGTLASGSAMAVCNGCGFNGGSGSIYLGTHNPTLEDQSNGLFHNQIPAGFFQDAWVFDISPAGFGTMNFIFQPAGGVTGLTMTLYKSDTGVTNCGVVGGACTAIGITGAALSGTPALGVITPFGISVGVPYGPTLFGQYVLYVEGTSVNQPGQEGYSGNVTTTTIPEPATLALVGLALVGVGMASRRRAA